MYDYVSPINIIQVCPVDCVYPPQVSAISILFVRNAPVPLVVPDPNANGQRELLLSLLLSLLALLMLPVLSLWLLLIALLLLSKSSDPLRSSSAREDFSTSSIIASDDSVVAKLELELATAFKSVISSSQSIFVPSAAELLTIGRSRFPSSWL